MWILEIPKLKLKIMHNFSKISWMDKAKVKISQFLRKQLKKLIVENMSCSVEMFNFFIFFKLSLCLTSFIKNLKFFEGNIHNLCWKLTVLIV